MQLYVEEEDYMPLVELEKLSKPYFLFRNDVGIDYGASVDT